MSQRANLTIFVRVLLAVLLVFPGVAVHADEVQTLGPAADSTLQQANPTANYGGERLEVTSQSGGQNRRAVSRFGLTGSIPAGSAVKTSILMLVMEANEGSRNHAAHRITGDPQWTESGVTWNSRDGGTNWASAGGDFFGTAADTITTGTTNGATLSWNIRTDGGVTNIPQGWLDGTVANRGLLIKDTAEDSSTRRRTRYFSKETGVGSQQPRLEVHYLRDVTLGAATPGISEVTWSWTFPTGSTSANYDGALFVKKAGSGASFVFSPTDGSTYAAGDDLGNSESVALNTSAFATVSAKDENGAGSVVLPGTAYTYKAFTHDATTITGALSAAPPHYAFGVSENVTTLTGGGTSKNWSYKTGAATLAPPGLDPGNTVVTGGNDNKIHSMSSSNGGRRYRPVAPFGTTGGAIQSRPAVIAAAFSSTGIDVAYTGAGDGKVYAFNTLTGVKLWESVVLALGGGSIQGGQAVQPKAFSDSGFTYSRDLVYVGTRNVGAGSDTNNRVVALDGNTGAVVWTFAPGNLDMINSTPAVDLANNAVWVASRGGTAGNQPSLWKLNCNSGALLESFVLGDIDGSPTINADGKQVYVVTNAGNPVAVRTDIASCSLSTSPGTGAGVGFPIPISTGTNADDIYFTTATTVNKVHFTYGAASCTGTFTTPATGWTNPTISAPSTPVFTPTPLALFLYVGSSDGRLRKIDPNSGAILATRDVNLSATVGDPSFDVVSLRIYVGDTSGRIYSFDQF